MPKAPFPFGCTNYKQYLETDWWKRRRYALLKQKGFRCTYCDSGEKIQVHHLNYERLGAEPDCDLIPLCRECHAAQHSPKKWRQRCRELGTKIKGAPPRKQSKEVAKERDRSERYAKLYQPWLKEDRERMRQRSVPIPEPWASIYDKPTKRKRTRRGKR